MPNFAAALKQEISRLARKEVRALTEGTTKLARQHRSEIAALKRQIRDLEKQLARIRAAPPSKAAESKSSPSAERPEGVPDGFRYSVRSLRSQRRRLKLSAAQYAGLLGVSMQTVYNWEHAKARPRASQMAAIQAVRDIGRREALAKLTELGIPADPGAKGGGGKNKTRRAATIGRASGKTSRKTTARKKASRKAPAGKKAAAKRAAGKKAVGKKTARKKPGRARSAGTAKGPAKPRKVTKKPVGLPRPSGLPGSR